MRQLLEKLRLYFTYLTLGILLFPVFNYLTGWAEPTGRIVKSPYTAEERDLPQATPVSNSGSSHWIARFPVEGHSTKDIIGVFGSPRGDRLHEGVDIKAPKGTPVVAVVKGTVTRVRDGGLGGRQIWLQTEGEPLEIYYAHLQRQFVVEGQQVEPGDIIGTVGSTGNARTPHLHFCLYLPGRKAIDPMPFLEMPQ